MDLCDSSKRSYSSSSSSETEVKEIKEPPLKKSKITHLSNEISCCSCHESYVPYLLLIGCSNRHTMCHLCTRMFISSKIIMNKFPRYFPGKISSTGELECPMCRESINGLTNMFIFNEDHNSEATYICPYKELLSSETTRTIGCYKKFTLTELHKHLIQLHNQTIKCPNCSTWLCDGEKNMEDLLQFHIMKHCQEIKCYGCDRTSNMINMYMHSIIGIDRVCETAQQMFQTFGQQLSECFYLFENNENMTQLATTMMRWVVQYIYQRQFGTDVGIDVFGKEFHRIFNAFIVQAFCHIHATLVDTDVTTLLNNILQLTKGTNRNEYEENVLLLTSAFSKKRQLRLDRMSRLPFFYRILIMTMSDFQFAQKITKKYPKNLTITEQADINKLIEVYQKIITEETLPTLTFQFPGLTNESTS
jgi:hypothetical protein